MHLKIFFALALLLAVFYTAKAAVSQSLPSSDHPGKCWIGDREYDVGTHHPDGECVQVHCASDFSAELQTCGVAIGPDGQRKTKVDLSKKYPECCP